jgi:hypothetical protein
MGPQVLRASLPLLASAGQGKRRRYSFDPGLASFEKIQGKKNNLLFCWLLQIPVLLGYHTLGVLAKPKK